MLEATLLDKKSVFHKAAIRRESLTEDGNSFRFINRFTNYDNDMLLCQIVQFEQGLSQMTIVIDEDADMFEVNPISAKDIKQSSVSKEKKKCYRVSGIYGLFRCYGKPYGGNGFTSFKI